MQKVTILDFSWVDLQLRFSLPEFRRLNVTHRSSIHLFWPRSRLRGTLSERKVKTIVQNIRPRLSSIYLRCGVFLSLGKARSQNSNFSFKAAGRIRISQALKKLNIHLPYCGLTDSVPGTRDIAKELHQKQAKSNKEQVSPAGMAQQLSTDLRSRGSRFDSQSGHVPGLRVRSPVGDVWESDDQ